MLSDWESTEKSSLKKVVIRSQNIKKWGTMVFGATRDDLVIYVPQSKKAEYEKILRSTNGLDFHAKIVGKKGKGSFFFVEKKNFFF